MQELKITPREYQEKIVETAKKYNTLVVLPTGLGKTAIALMLAVHMLKQKPRSKILFLAPTRPLAEQHFKTFKKELPELWAQLELFTGKIESKKRRQLWQTADIIFSTPQCIANDHRKKMIDLESVSLLIEDEAHRCMKNYAYTYVAQQCRHSKILGLTASPGSTLSVINDIKKNLNIEKIEMRTREDLDVKPYLQKLENEIIKVELPDEFKSIRELFKRIYQKKIDELTNRSLLYTRPSKTELIKLQSKLGRAVSSGNLHFNNLRGLSICAQAIKLQYALELLETQDLSVLNNYLQKLFEEAKEKKTARSIVNDDLFGAAYVLVSKAISEKMLHPKILKLKEIIEREKAANKDARMIIFSQYRDTVSKINSELENQGIVKSKVFVGQLKKGTMGMNQKEQAQILDKFREKEIDCLISTSIGEEGLDLPEVNLVVFYEPIPSVIRKIQRKGRTARLMAGKVITLITKGTRDESNHWAAHYKEKKMYGMLREMQEKERKMDEKDKDLKQKEIFDF